VEKESLSTTPVPLQVVFQGGGAKLCHLMAVCDVLKDYEASGRIRVTRAAGSSAGAIVAVMLASTNPISEYKVRVTQTAARFIPRSGSRRRLLLFLGGRATLKRCHLRWPSQETCSAVTRL
jgi:predicted acylesterase/phospholipase RssA